MSERKINLEEIMQEHVDPHCFLKKECYERVIEAMKEACKQTLELAAENAKKNAMVWDAQSSMWTPESNKINKQSILDTIKQIE